MAAYYNEIDPAAAAWLRELIKAGMIAPGEVDERDMWDVVPADIMGFDQWHFCAGIGIWSHALRCAGWPDDRQILTISLPCQSFSAAGQGKGFDDHRGQLAEAYFWMLDQLRPVVCIGEQVEAALRHDWLDVMATQMEARGYTVGAVSTPACGYGSPHKRSRLYWVAQSGKFGRRGRSNGYSPRNGRPLQIEGRSPFGILADAEHAERWAEHKEQREAHGRDGLGRNGNAGIVGDSGGERLPEQRSVRGTPRGQVGAAQWQAAERTGAPTNGFWANCEWIPCRDGKARPTGRGIHPLVGRMEHPELWGCESGQLRVVGERTESQRAVDTGQQEAGPTQSRPIALAARTSERVVRGCDQGAPADEIDPQNTAEARVMRLRGYGNAIVGPQAAAFIKAYMEV